MLTLRTNVVDVKKVKRGFRILSGLYRKKDFLFRYALLTFRVKTAILTLRYCGNFIKESYIWVLFCQAPLCAEKNMERIPRYGISRLLKFHKDETKMKEVR